MLRSVCESEVMCVASLSRALLLECCVLLVAMLLREWELEGLGGRRLMEGELVVLDGVPVR